MPDFIDEPTDRQLEILELIAHSIEDDGIPPTIREVMAALEIRSTNSVADHFRAMVRKGHLERTGVNVARGLRITERGWFWLKVRKGYDRPDRRRGAAQRAIEQRVAKAIVMLERGGSRVADIIAVLKGAQAA